MIKRGNFGCCLSYFSSVFVNIYLSLSKISCLIATFVFELWDTLFLFFDQVELVPQGSFVSVFCFAFAINDIVTAVPDGFSCSFYIYIYDFVSYLSRSTFPFTVRRMKLAINRILEWIDSYGSCFSI